MAAKKEKLKAVGSSPVDIHVGARIRIRRQVLGADEQVLARMLQISVDEFRLIERGEVRIGAERLYSVARHLEAPISWFFAGVDAVTASVSAEVQVADDRLKDGAKLLVFLYEQSTPATRTKIIEVARVLHEGDAVLPCTEFPSTQLHE